MHRSQRRHHTTIRYMTAAGWLTTVALAIGQTAGTIPVRVTSLTVVIGLAAATGTNALISDRRARQEQETIGEAAAAFYAAAADDMAAATIGA